MRKEFKVVVECYDGDWNTMDAMVYAIKYKTEVVAEDFRWENATAYIEEIDI